MDLFDPKPPIERPDTSCHLPDPWLATSTLQKAIRRGHQQIALAATSYLIDGHLDRLWRRLTVISLEDVGIADLDLVRDVLLASPIWKATWYDAVTRQTRRVSLGTEDFQDAKAALAEFVVRQAQPKDQKPADTALALILFRYWEAHGKNLPSSEAAQYALGYWNEFWREVTIADLTIPRQKEFIAWLSAKGYSNSYVSRTLSVGRAAIRMAWKHGEIMSAPFIMDVTDRSDAREPYRLDKAEMKTLLTKVQEWPHLYAYVVIALNTLARPDAILDLAPAQVRLDDRHIHLNPKGRKQTKKYRPIVPITDTLLPFVQKRDVKRFVNWHGAPIGDIKKGFKTVVRAAGLSDDITPYSLRHTMAVELRKRGVPAWEVSGLLGHRTPGVTEVYAEFSPDYLSKGREVIDAYFADLGVLLPVPKGLCVSVACQSLETEKSAEADFSTFSGGPMVVGSVWREPVSGRDFGEFRIFAQ